MADPQLYPILKFAQGMLYAMAKPSAESLISDINALKEAGISNVVCLLEDSESNNLGLSDEDDMCTALGLTFSRFPIKDYGVPEPAQLTPFIENLYTEICNGASTVIHCRGGIGRTGLICACLLIRAGYSADNAIALVTEKRKETVPETADQIAAVMKFNNQYATKQS